MIRNESLRVCIPNSDFQQIGGDELVEILKDGTQDRFEVEAGCNGLAEIGNDF